MALNDFGSPSDTMYMAMRQRPRSLQRLPEGSHLELPGTGTAWARILPSSSPATPVLLLHGWTATADLNWAGTYEALWPRRTVVAPDHHGHGRGIRRDQRFSIEDAADDAVRVLDHLGLSRAVVVGYSMGGAVAQVLARRHPDRAAGLVLCATSSYFCETARDRLGFRFLGRAANALRPAPGAVHRSVAAAFLRAKHGEDAEVTGWISEELGLHHWPTVLEAGTALGDHDSRDWVGELDLPTRVIVTSDDRVVPTARQLALGRLIPGASIDVVRGSHDVCLRSPEVLAKAVSRACDDVSTGRRPSSPAAPAGYSSAGSR